MAKRMTDTNKWDKEWFRKLSPEYKCFWDFILSKCDLAGIWDVDFSGASFHIGKTIDPQKAAKFFAEQIHVISPKKWFIIDFVGFQNGHKPLNPKSPIHQKIIEILTLNRLYPTLYNTLLNRVQGEGVVIEEEKGEGKGEGVPEEILTPAITYPFNSDRFLNYWKTWCDYKKEQFKFTYKPIGEQGALKELSELAAGSEDKAIAIINQSINKGWKGFFDIKNNTNGTNQFTGNGTEQKPTGFISGDLLNQMHKIADENSKRNNT